MFVRLAFAVAINIEPEILIVDEALSVGDVFFQAKCYRKFEEFKKMGKTILMVSHDLSSISKYCDKVILLNHGVKMDEGEPKEIVDLYKKVLVGQAGEDAGQAEAVIEVAEENQEKKNLETADKWVRPFQMNPQLLEYGDKRVKIRDFTIQDAKGNYTNTIEKNTTFKILVSIQFETKVQEPIVAYTFKNVHGTEITGTNTMYEKMDIRPCEEGEEVIITFTQKMNLQGGEYLLSLGCTGYQDGSFTVFHRLYDVCNITVVSNKNTVGFYDMNSEITVEYR